MSDESRFDADADRERLETRNIKDDELALGAEPVAEEEEAEEEAETADADENAESQQARERRRDGGEAVEPDEVP